MHNGIAEQWKSIQGYEGLYEVSNQGRVRSLTRVVDCADGLARTFQGQFLQQPPAPDGHHQVRLYRNAVGKTSLVHVLVLEAFSGARPGGNVSRHLNDNPSDNRVANLRWGTQRENIEDMVRNGTHVNTRKSQCKRGHPLVDPNLKPKSKPRRECIACGRAKSWLHGSHGPDYDRGLLQQVSDRYYRDIVAERLSH